MKLSQKYFYIYKGDIYIFPTLRIFIKDLKFFHNNFSIEFHWIIFHARLLFKKNLEGFMYADTDSVRKEV